MYLSNNVLVLEDYLPEETCSLFIDRFDELRSSPGMTSGGGLDLELKNSKDMFISVHHPELVEHILPHFINVARLYRKHVNLPLATDRLSPIVLRKYSEGEGFFSEHVDVNYSSNIFRAFIILFYLNDVEQGGELVLPRLNLKIMPRRGLTVCFPCSWEWPHSVNKVVKGDRYIIRSFVEITPE